MHWSVRGSPFSWSIALILSFGAALAACTATPSGGSPDASHPQDSGTAASDGGNDAAAALVDTGTPLTDAATGDAGSDAASNIDAAFVPTDAGGSLLSCGGRGGHVCATTEYCDYTGGAACGAADNTGICRGRPSSCSTMPMTACGCDGVAYTNACEAARAGFDITGTFSCLTP